MKLPRRPSACSATRALGGRASAEADEHGDGGRRAYRPTSAATSTATSTRERPARARLVLLACLALLATACRPEQRFHVDGVLRSVGRRSPATRAEEGFWTYWYPNGALREQGRYAGGRRIGMWEQFHPNGKRWAQGRRQWNSRTGCCERLGVWTFWYPNGVREARGVFVAGRREGHWEYAHPDGSLDGDRSGEYCADLRAP